MRKTAGFLKVICIIAIVFEVIAIVCVAVALAAVAFVGDFSAIAEKTGGAITISSTGTTLTPAEMDALKPVILVALGIALLTLIFAFLGTKKEKNVLAECQAERPFSAKSVSDLKGAARLELIGGFVGVAGAVVMMFMGKNLQVNGTSVGNSSLSLNLSFLIYAVQKYLLYHVAEYGHSLENR